MDIETDEELVSMIQNGGLAREKALHKLYKLSGCRDKLIGMIRNNKGNVQDGEDMYQEAIIILDKNIREGNFRKEGKLDSYLFSIGKFLWMNQLRKKKLTLKESFADIDSGSDELLPDILMMKEEQKAYLQSFLTQLGPKCQHILELWQLSYSMEEIASKTGIGDAALARKAKYDCQKKLLSLIAKHPEFNNEIK